MFYRGNRQILPIQRRRMRRFLLTMPVVLSAYLFVAGESGFYQLWHRDRQIETLRREIQTLEETNHRLQKDVALLKDDLGTIERIARERYGMVTPNESVYMVYPHSLRDSVKGKR